MVAEVVLEVDTQSAEKEPPHLLLCQKGRILDGSSGKTHADSLRK
jgi:hypothetical protein